MRNEDLIAAGLIAAWATSVIECVHSGSWLLLVLDLFFWPVGVVNGIGIWFGLF